MESGSTLTGMGRPSGLEGPAQPTSPPRRQPQPQQTPISRVQVCVTALHSHLHPDHFPEVSAGTGNAIIFFWQRRPDSRAMVSICA